MNQRISIVVPVYNKAPYLKECFDSLLGQTYPDVEVIAVDDGSTDDSAAICREYCEKDERFHFLQQENAGQNAARKTGVDAATGDWIIFIDADDYTSLDMCDIFMTEMRRTDADMVVAAVQNVHADHTLGSIARSPAGIYQGVERLRNGYAPQGSIILYTSGEGRLSTSLCFRMFRKQQIKESLAAFDMSVRFGEDASCLLPMMAKMERISYLPDVVYYCRDVQGSVSRAHAAGRTLKKFAQLGRYLDKRFDELGLLPELQHVIDGLLFTGMLFQSYEYFDDYDGIFPYFRGDATGRIAIYGAGAFGKEFYLKEKDRLNIVGWFDQRYAACQKQGLDVKSPDEMNAADFDCVLVTVQKDTVANEIAEDLRQKLPSGISIYTMSRDIMDSAYTHGKIHTLKHLD